MRNNEYIAKEIITVLENFDNEFVEKIPKEVFDAFKKLSKDCTKTVNLDMSKKLKDQDISQECKDFISIMYYYYHANDEEKKELISKWNDNDIQN